MALQFTTNSILTSSVDGSFILRLKNALISAGWVLKGSGNGTSAYSNVDTANGSSATDYFNSYSIASTGRAWFRIRTPNTMSDGNYREFCFQSTTVSQPSYSPFRVKYSRCVGGKGFVSGTITANSGTTPTAYTATDEHVYLGSPAYTDTGSLSSDQSGQLYGKYLTLSFGSNFIYLNIVCNNEYPYNFSTFYYNKTSLGASGYLAFDSLLENTYNPGDTEPTVFLKAAQGFSAESYSILGIGTANQKAVSLTFDTIPTTGQDPITGNDVFLPISYYRARSASLPTGWKGVSKYLFQPTTMVGRNPLDTFNLNGTKDKIFLGSNSSYFIFDWDGSLPGT